MESKPKKLKVGIEVSLFVKNSDRELSHISIQTSV